jgi:hypothetical protein
MKTPSHLRGLFAALIVGFVSGIIIAPEAWSQQKQTLSFKNTANNSRYVQQHVIDVGDVPGHQVRIYEIQWKYPSGEFSLEGVKVTESWIRGFSDYTNGNGPNSSYNTYILEDGNKVFTKSAGASQTTLRADGTKSSRFFTVENFVGGTGKFRGIHGTLRLNGNFDPKAGWLTVEVDGEYWIED